MSVSLSLKKRVKGLLSLVLAIATIVAVFPPIDAQASNYYYFLTGFDGSSLNVGYLVQSNHPYIALDYASSGSFVQYFSLGTSILVPHCEQKFPFSIVPQFGHLIPSL